MLGVIMALAFERTCSLYPALCLHAVCNGAVVVFVWRMSRSPTKDIARAICRLSSVYRGIIAISFIVVMGKKDGS